MSGADARSAWPSPAAAFLLFNWYFLAPYNTLVVSNPLDWLVLVAFLIVSIVAAQLLHRERQRAEETRQRADEVDRLATLGAETLSVGRADQALSAITTVIRETLGIKECRIHQGTGGAAAGEDPLVAWAAQSGQIVRRRADGTVGRGRRRGTASWSWASRAMGGCERC